jgi:Zn-dependent protease with chaperone function
VNYSELLAVVVAITTGVAALLVPRHLRPERAVRLTTALAVLSFASFAWALFLVLLANVVQLHGVAERLAWCSDLVTNHRDSFTPVGLAALAVAFAAVVSATRVRRNQRRQRTPPHHDDFAVIPSDEPVAYALPGRPGQVVVSTGMLNALDVGERRVLIAHERAHLRKHHHRYLSLIELAAASLPLLAPLNGRLRFAVERWADEEAAKEVGDRALVASAIASAALASQRGPADGLGIADSGVVERVEIMLAGSHEDRRLTEVALLAVVLHGVGGLVASIAFLEPWVLALFGLCS